jgi:hypothetical protein
VDGKFSGSEKHRKTAAKNRGNSGGTGRKAGTAIIGEFLRASRQKIRRSICNGTLLSGGSHLLHAKNGLTSDNDGSPCYSHFILTMDFLLDRD